MDKGFDIPIIKAFTSHIDIIEDVVNDVDLTNIDGIENLSFIYGDEDYIVNKLTDWNKSRTKRATMYPLIALFNDFQEDENNVIRLTLVICNSTNPKYDNNQRKLNNFIPVLNPLYDQFLKAVQRHPRIEGKYEYLHRKFDMYSIGRKPLFVNKTVSTDYVDAIRIENLELEIIKT